MPSKDKYTDPKLRDEVKEELHNSDKGGAPGQWSARKAQMMASEYKKRGGDYNTDENQKDDSQKNLSKWGEEDWQTKEGSGNAKKEDGTQKRYLPKKAWENMSEEEKKETDNKKQEESKEGKQHVENTDAAKKSRRNASKKDDKNEDESEKQVKRHDSAQENEDEEKEQDEEAGDDQAQQDDDKENQKEDDDEAENEDDAEYKEEGEDEQEEDEEEEEEQDDSNAKTGQKRSRSPKQASSKKQKSNSGNAKSNDDKDSKKTIGSKHMDAKEPGKKGSADRLPKKDQQVSWKAMPGYVQGKVVEILQKGKDVDGKSVKASEKDPKLVLKSDSSGKICVHKPDACFYD